MSSKSLSVSQSAISTVKAAFRRSVYSSQIAFANELGMSRDTVSKFLNGKPVGRLNFIEISELLGLSWQEIVEVNLEGQNFQDQRQVLLELPFQNLPRQINNFIGREDEIKRLLEYISLDYRAPYITVNGIGGVGKTALVLEAAYRCWEYKHGFSNSIAPTFNAIIFVTAKENKLLPGGIVSNLQRQSTLRDIFREIARGLDDIRIVQAEPDEQLSLVRESLSKQKTLLIVDNLETISNQNEVLAFLDNLPQSSKAVITTRDVTSRYAPIYLDALPKIDSIALLQQQAKEKNIKLCEEDCDAIYNRFGGVPVALIYAVGQLSSRYPLGVLLNRSVHLPDDVARFCFESSVAPLRDEASHKLLMALAVFAESPIKDAWIDVAGFGKDLITAEKGIAQLLQLSLVNEDSGRFNTLSLTKEYALSELSLFPDFKKEAQERWIAWYLQMVQKYGGDEWSEWHINYDRIQQESGNLLSLLDWLAGQDRYDEIKIFWKHFNDYANIYGYWEDRLFWLQWLLDESQRRGDWSTYVEIASSKGFLLTLTRMDKRLQEADELLLSAWEMKHHADTYVQCDLAIHLAIHCLNKAFLEEAKEWLRVATRMTKALAVDTRFENRIKTAILYHFAQIYNVEGQLSKAMSLFKKTVEVAELIDWQRAVNYAKNGMAELLIWQGQIDEAAKLLKVGLEVAYRNKDKRCIAFYERSSAYLDKARGNQAKARQWALAALDKFKELGMMRDIEVLESFLETLN